MRPASVLPGNRGRSSGRGFARGLLLAPVLGLLAWHLALAQPPALPGGPGTGKANSAADLKAQARSKMLQGRAALSQGDFETAEAIARDIGRMRVHFAYTEDSPAQLLQDLAKARSEPKALLQAARFALTKGRFDKAQSYAQMAERNGSVMTFPIWGDTPSKCLKDIEKARKEGSKVAKPATVKTPAKPSPVVKTPPRPEPVKNTVAQRGTLTREPLMTNNPVPVETKAEEKPAPRAVTAAPVTPAPKPVVQGTKSPTPPVVQTSYNAKPTTPAQPKTTAKPKMGDADQARALVRKAREAMAANRLDEAKRLNNEARALRAYLGWWEDNPDRVQADIDRIEGGRKKQSTMTEKAKSSRSRTENIPTTKDEAKKFLGQGRKMLEQGKIEDAALMAQRVKSATTLTWGLFEDSPDRLTIDVEKARAKRDRALADKMLVDARKLYQKGDYEGASKLAYNAQKLHGPYSIWDLGDRPSKVLADIQTAQARNRKVPVKGAPKTVTEPKKPEPTAVAQNKPAPAPVGVLPSGVVPAPEKTKPDNATRLRAQQLVAEAQRHMREGNLVLARQKAVEAQRLNVTFTYDEVSPATVYQQVAVEVRQRIDGLVRQADETAANGAGTAQVRFQAAQKKLTEARQLAVTFGQDLKPIDNKMQEIGALVQATPAQPIPTKPVPTQVVQADHSPTKVGQQPTKTQVVPTSHQTTVDHGQKLLDNARLELKSGQTANARKMAEEAYARHPEVRGEAETILRTIDAEEFGQKRLAANRTFDAAQAAYNRREYTVASNLIASIDVRQLDPARTARLRELSMTPELRPGVARATDKPGTTPAPKAVAKLPSLNDTDPVRNNGITQTGGLTTNIGNTAAPGTARATDAADGGLLDETKRRRAILFDKWRSDGMEVQRKASAKFRAGQTEEALDLLQDYMASLLEAQLDPAQIAQLKRPVDSRLNQFRLLKQQKDLAAGVLASKKAQFDKVADSRKAEELKRKNVDKLMRDFNARFKEGKYEEAEALAMRAHELDPDNGVASAAIYMARRQRSVNEYRDLKTEREELVRQGLNDADTVGPVGALKTGITFDKKRWDEVKGRKPFGPISIGKMHEREKAIERKLETPVTLNFEGAPLKQVLDDLRDVNGINIVVDGPALQEEGISLDSPVTIKLNKVSLKSALNLLLHQVHLTHVIKDEVLQITTEARAKGKLKTVTYQVADLVIPIPNFNDVKAPNYAAPGVVGTQPSYPSPTPMNGPTYLGGGQPTGSPAGSSMLSTSPGGSSGGPALSNATTTSRQNASGTMEEQLMKLITSTISPRSWAEMGGPGTIDYHPLTLALVVNQSADIQEQIQDLLAALRRLQDQEVAVEVRFITVSEDFFERIGVNFNMNILTDSANNKFEPSLVTGNFVSDPNRFIQAFNPGRFISGLTPAGTLTPGLDIPITNNSFFQTVPNFGGYTGGGLSMGLAFLSDIQVFLFMEAVQGDVRANVMQAPKLTLFNGQTSTLFVGDQQSFVTGVQVAQAGSLGGNFALVPITQTIPSQTNITIQAVISADRRFVRLSLPLQLTNLVPGPVQVFPVTTPVFPFFDPNPATGQPVVFTQYIQQPVFANINVSTTVSVPDGGTVLMGGLKRLSESRNEFGPPILSKIPYVNRLFKNVGYGRETDSLMIMVTPRIIIQEEEEERATGFRNTPAVNLP